jgi:HKD family nuclease
MAKAEILLQGLTGHFHSVALRKLLNQSDLVQFVGSIAYVKEAGVTAIAGELGPKSALATFFVGIRNDITTKQGLSALLDLGVTLLAVDTGSRRLVYHPKLYLAKRKNHADLIIGSANLTKGGLSRNLETSVILELEGVSLASLKEEGGWRRSDWFQGLGDWTRAI